jgi:hypothetical protein
MDWLSKIQKQAQEAADMLVSSEAAERARQLAFQATQQATVLAQQATVKAQVCKLTLAVLQTAVAAMHNQPELLRCCRRWLRRLWVRLRRASRL